MKNIKNHLCLVPQTNLGKCWPYMGDYQRRIRYIQNALISEIDHQKEEFELDGQSAVFFNYYNKKQSTTKLTL